jgi:hypothetical protein
VVAVGHQAVAALSDPAKTNIRFKFHAMATRFNSPLTCANPRSENWRNLMTDLTMPMTGSTVHLRFA